MVENLLQFLVLFLKQKASKFGIDSELLEKQALHAEHQREQRAKSEYPITRHADGVSYFEKMKSYVTPLFPSYKGGHDLRSGKVDPDQSEIIPMTPAKPALPSSKDTPKSNKGKGKEKGGKR